MFGNCAQDNLGKKTFIAGSKSIDILFRPQERTKYPLHIIFIIDASYSMRGEKIHALNYAMHEALASLRDAGEDHPEVEIFFSCISFSKGAHWHFHRRTPLSELKWVDFDIPPNPPLENTDMGAAMHLVADFLKDMPERACSPLLVLVMDGRPTDDYLAGIKALLSSSWGGIAQRISMAIGADADMEALQAFIGDKEIRPLQANNPDALITYIKWCDEYIPANNSCVIPESPDISDVGDCW